MECIALIISLVSLFVATLALYFSILKPGHAELFPYLEELELTPGSQHNGVALSLGGTLRFMIKNSGAGSVFVNDISWREEIVGISKIDFRVSLNSRELYMDGLTLKPYEHKLGSVNVRYSLNYQGQNVGDNIGLLRTEIAQGKIFIEVKYSAYEDKNVRKVVKSFDITEKMKHFIFKD